MERGRLLEMATIFGAAAVLGVLAYVAAVGLYEIDNYGKAAEKTAFGAGQYTTVRVYAAQYRWVFDVNGTRTINEVKIKAGRLYRFEVTSVDVIHSFYIRELGYKYDAIPGQWYVMWVKIDRPGTYHILCAEFCGAGHYLMVGKIVVEP